MVMPVMLQAPWAVCSKGPAWLSSCRTRVHSWKARICPHSHLNPVCRQGSANLGEWPRVWKALYGKPAPWCPHPCSLWGAALLDVWGRGEISGYTVLTAHFKEA